MKVPERRSTLSRTGRIGELFVEYVLERHGIQAVHADREEHDLWVRTPGGLFRTMQVKAANHPQKVRAGEPRYSFYFKGGFSTSDIVALVALDAEVVLFRPGMRSHGSVKASSFTPEEMERSITELLQ